MQSGRCRAEVRRKHVQRRHKMIAAREEKGVTPAHVLSTALEAARGAPATHLPHEQAEIEGARVDQEPFENVAMPRRCVRRMPPVS